MRLFLAVTLSASLVAACADAPEPTVATKPFTGHVPRIPGNYEAAARLPQPPPPTTTSSSNDSSNTDYGQSADPAYCAGFNPPRYKKACEKKAEKINERAGYN